MKVFFLLLILVSVTLQQGWLSETPLEIGSDFSIASDDNETLLAFTTTQGLQLDSTPFNTSLSVPDGQSHLIMKTLGGNWILILYTSQGIRGYKTTIDNFGSWSLVFGFPCLDQEIALAPSSSGQWTACWAGATGEMNIARSYDHGSSWSIQTLPYTNFSSPSLTVAGESDWLMSLSMNGFEILVRLSNDSVIYNTTGSGKPHVVASDQTILFLSGSGYLVVSKDMGISWSTPMMIGVGSIVSQGNGSWTILTHNLDLFQSTDDAETWTQEKIGSKPVDKIDLISPDKVIFMRNGTISTVSRDSSTSSFLLSVPSDQSIIVTEPLVINQSLLIEGSLFVGSALIVNGDLILTNSSVLDLTSQTSPIQVIGNFTAAGRLLIPVTYRETHRILVNSSSVHGVFDEIDGDNCSKVEYAQNQVIVTFQVGCDVSTMPTWTIILLIVIPVVALAFVISIAIFCPYREKKYRLSDVEAPTDW